MKKPKVKVNDPRLDSNTTVFLERELTSVDPRRYSDRFDQSPACLNIIDFKNPLDARLILFNDTSHYSNIPISS